MQRKDGAPKLKAKRNLPRFQFGFKDHPQNQALSSRISIADQYPVMSFFCGCGGMDLGFTGGFYYLNQTYPRHPFQIIQAIDNSQDAVETYNLNLHQQASLQDLTSINLNDLPTAEILLGGFPCQDFSSSGSKLGLSGTRGQLYQVMVDYMALHQPKIVVGENVPHLSRLNGGSYLRKILNDLEDVGYRFAVWDLYGPDYGLSQSRRRLFLIGVRQDLPGDPIQPISTHHRAHIPIDVALSDLETIDDESVPNQSQYFVSTKATSGGGQGDHTNQAGTVAYCIRANSRGRIQFHYKLPRRLTVRECARLQSFPDQFVFPYSTQRNLTLIGNAVPPILAYQVATSIKDYLEQISHDHAPLAQPIRYRSSRSIQLELAVDG
jgi:DNA (cytosine-5)-methyltransferase 1